MPQKSGFFDTTADDPREYPAREFAEYFSRFIGNGIFSGGTVLKVTATGADAKISIGVGYAWINGYLYSVYDMPLTLPIQPATTQDRIDRIVLRLDISTPVRSIRAVVLQGTPAGAPSPPAITRSGSVYDISLAQVLVKANTSTVQPTNITDERLNNAVCGIVTGLIDQVDTTTIFNEFYAWMVARKVQFTQEWQEMMESIINDGFAPLISPTFTGVVTAPHFKSTNNAGRNYTASDWADFSANSGGQMLLANNAYTDGNNSWKYANTHPSMGARGIRMSVTGGIEMFDTGSIATTAGVTFTPTWSKVAGLGTGNRDVNLVKAITHQIDTRSTTLRYDTNGVLTKVEEKDGSTVVKTTNLIYTSGKLMGVEEIAGGKKVTKTLSYNSDQLIGVTKAVE